MAVGVRFASLLLLCASARAEEVFRRPAVRSTKPLVALTAKARLAAPRIQKAWQLWSTASVPAMVPACIFIRTALPSHVRELKASKHEAQAMLANGMAKSNKERTELIAAIAGVEEIEAVCAKITELMTVDLPKMCASCAGAYALSAIGVVLYISFTRKMFRLPMMPMSETCRLLLPDAKMTFQMTWRAARTGAGFLTACALYTTVLMRFAKGTSTKILVHGAFLLANVAISLACFTSRV